MANELYEYWDSCVFIDAIAKTKGRYEVIEQILDGAERGKIIIVTSMLALAEVVKCKNDLADGSCYLAC